MLKLTMMALVLVNTMSLAYADRVDECATPGQKLDSKFLNYRGVKVSSNLARTSTNQNNFTTDLTAEVYKDYLNKYCERQNYTIEETKCSPIDLDLALGKGNVNFKNIYNLSKTLLTRAQALADGLKYDQGQEASVRLETAKSIVIFLVGKASVSEMPANWTEFTAQLNEAADTNKVARVSVDDITKTFEASNKAKLGFMPVENVEIKENQGNAVFTSLFDLTRSENQRVKTLRSLVVGLTDASTVTLSHYLINFASVNGIPNNWAQFTLMLKSSVDEKSLTAEEYREIIRSNEFINRENLGFSISASQCLKVQRTESVKVITGRVESEFSHLSTKKVTLNVSSLPLLSNESESFIVSFDGVSQASIQVGSEYNSYVYSIQSTKELDNLSLVGTRIRVSPRNTSYAQVLRTGDIVNLMFQNKGYDSKIDGKIIVNVDFFERNIFFDKKIGSRTIIPTNGDLLKYLSEVKVLHPNKKVYLQISMKYENSTYFNENFSGTLNFE